MVKRAPSPGSSSEERLTIRLGRTRITVDRLPEERDLAEDVLLPFGDGFAWRLCRSGGCLNWAKRNLWHTCNDCKISRICWRTNATPTDSRTAEPCLLECMTCGTWLCPNCRHTAGSTVCEEWTAYWKLREQPPDNTTSAEDRGKYSCIVYYQALSRAYGSSIICTSIHGPFVILALVEDGSIMSVDQ